MNCPTCERSFAEGTYCPFDGTRLIDPAAEGLSADDPLIGHVLGQRYRLEQRIGAGGMGTVYKATHVLMEKPVAVKVLRPELANDAYAAGRFRREARSAGRIEHENCLAVSDFGQEADGTHYLVMEYLEGRTLWQTMKECGPLPVPRVVDLGSQIARALAAAHQQGVVHRDLKPENVMLVQRGERRDLVKVLDFGLAKVVQASEENAFTALTRHGMIFGTPRYMSPEQIEGRETDPRADLYGFGVILYEMVTGKLPFEDRSVVALLNKHVHEQPVPPSLRVPALDLPVRLEQLILALMAKEADRRPAHAGEVVRELEAIALELERPGPAGDEVPAAGAPSGPVALPGRRGLAWLLPACAGAAAGTVLTVATLLLVGALHDPRAAAPAAPAPVAEGPRPALRPPGDDLAGSVAAGSGALQAPPGPPRVEGLAGSLAGSAAVAGRPAHPGDAAAEAVERPGTLAASLSSPPAAARPALPPQPPAGRKPGRGGGVPAEKAAQPRPAAATAAAPGPAGAGVEGHGARPAAAARPPAARPADGSEREAQAPSSGAVDRAAAGAKTAGAAGAAGRSGEAAGSEPTAAMAGKSGTPGTPVPVPPEPATVVPVQPEVEVAVERGAPAEAGGRTAASTLDGLLREARAALGRRQYEIAGKLLQRALNAAPGDPRVHAALANLHFERGRFDAALSSARRAVALHPAGVSERMLLGQIAYKSGDRDLACRSFGEVLRLAPGHERAQRYRSKVGCP